MPFRQGVVLIFFATRRRRAHKYCASSNPYRAGSLCPSCALPRPSQWFLCGRHLVHNLPPNSIAIYRLSSGPAVVYMGASLGRAPITSSLIFSTALQSKFSYIFWIRTAPVALVSSVKFSHQSHGISRDENVVSFDVFESVSTVGLL